MNPVRLLLAVSIVAGALMASGCTGFPFKFIRGPVRTVSQDFDITGFDAVDASTAFNIALTRADGYAVKVTVDESVADKLIVEKRGNTLAISLRPGAWSAETLQAEITMPALSKLMLSGASRAALAGFSGGEEFAASLSGASVVTGDMSAVHTQLDIAGASRVTLRGQGESLEARGSGASVLNLGELVLRNALVELSGASRALVNAAQELDAKADGASTVEYIGDPVRVSAHAHGASTIRKH